MDVQLLPHQWQALHSAFKYTLLISGIGGGKTWCGVHWCINKCLSHPHSLGFIGATTYKQLRNSTLSAVFNELSRLEIPFSYNQSSGILEFLGKKWLCASMENPEPLRGIEVGEVWLDEAAFMTEYAFSVINGRLRDKKGSLKILLTTTPNAFNWVYDYFAGEKKTDQHQLIKASSYDNKFLPEGYLESLERNYDSKLIEQELKGEFVSLTQGQVYYAFDKSRNVKEFKVQPFSTNFIGADFNVDPMASVAAYISSGKIYVFKEFFLRNSNTPQACYEWNKSGLGGASIIPDSTARNRKTSGQSDIDIIQNNGFSVEYTRNPFVRDRVNNINRLLEQGKIIIHPQCKKLINDLEKVAWKEGRTELDQTTDKTLTHVSDSLGYLAHFLMPITSNRPQEQIRAIY